MFDLRGFMSVCPSYSWCTAFELGGAYVWKSFVLCIYNRGATVTSNKGKSYCPRAFIESKDNDLFVNKIIMMRFHVYQTNHLE